MTREQWLSCSDPQAMLDWLAQPGRLSHRKARLFAVACCRRIWPQIIADQRSKRAVETAERYADSQASQDDLVRARHAALASSPAVAHFNALDAAWECSRYADACLGAAEAAAHEVAWATTAPAEQLAGRYLLTPAGQTAYLTERAAQAELLRDLHGPFLAAPFDAAWRTAAVLSLAHHIYDDRMFDAMPVLGAALSDAGCKEQEILQHCSRGPHVRGCFLLDAILGRS